MLIFCKKKKTKKNANIGKIKVFLVLKLIFSETAYVYVSTHQISSFSHNSNECLTGGNFTHPSPSAKGTPKNLTQIKITLKPIPNR